MPAKRPKRPRDLNQWAKHMVDLATGAAQDPELPQESAAAQLGRKGGRKGGKARAEQDDARSAIRSRQKGSKGPLGQEVIIH